jgi:hypothetical protein
MPVQHAIDHIGGYATNRKAWCFAKMRPCRGRPARLAHCGEILLAAAAGLRQINGDANVKHGRSIIGDTGGESERAAGQ